jgi:glucose-6-phosphate 1-dehydrogenase
MKADQEMGPMTLTIFGGAGDLASRKLVPALYNLFLDEWMPKQYKILGVGHGRMSDEAFRRHLQEGVQKFSRRKKFNGRRWKEFASRISFLYADLEDPKSYAALGEKLAAWDEEWNVQAKRIFYLAVPPWMIQPVVSNLAKTKLNQDRQRTCIVIEKPFGRDLDSARQLNHFLLKIFDESQVFRIDHYLGKETVQNIMAFRFANTLFEPIWNRRYIDHVQITVAEQAGVEERGHYYDHAGALRDMIQNHLLQIFCLVAMEPPVSFNGNEIRNKKIDVLHALRPIPPEQINQYAVRGQYGAGWISGKKVPDYRSEPKVVPNSFTETFAAVKLYVDNWRWQGIPFYLRTGKRLATKISEVSIQFHPVPHQTFPSAVLMDRRPNRLVISIVPEEGILLRFESKIPGPKMLLSPVVMHFFYREAFRMASPEAYETLLLDVMRGDATLFMRADQAEAAWAVIAPILEMWDRAKPTDFPNYPAGSWGPEEADMLIAQDGKSWVMPSYLECKDFVCRVNPLSPS